jgi:phage/conjugal plasmid C-4 type zinc finger protein, traR family|nr:MAG TPA: DksA-like zinc finger domain containing protein [Caudoviricetes sp.]
MPDMFDKAQEIEQLERDHALRKRHTTHTASRLFCEDCDEPIPEMRRNKIPGCTRCVECQTIYETKQKHYRR